MAPMFEKVLVANRGEIAVRVMRTCQDLGIRTVAVYSDLDHRSLHVRIADEAFAIGGQTAAESYLNTDAILDVARRSGADALHPGYGFFSENADFARAIAAEGVTFIGPPPEAMEAMGEKIMSRRRATEAGVAPVPGSLDAAESADDVTAFGQEHGWPVAIKAAYGGGGRGMRVVHDADTVPAAFEACRREAQASFGRPELYVERYLTWPRHVEVQIFADTHGNAVWLGERDCSIQRRHQKLIEETPSPGLPGDVRVRMGEAAVRVARATGYVNAGTVEFLYQDGDAYFLEMNTRLQVEHPITELTTGIDLVEEQLRVAAGEPLSFSQETIQRRGHAIECRINAEDPTGGKFLPSPGTITRFSRPGGFGVRVDAGIGVGDTVSQHYDNLLAKIVVWGRDRDEARRRMRRALGETMIQGVVTNVPAHLAVLEHPDFAAGAHSTRWLEERLDFSALPAATTATATATATAAAAAPPEATPQPSAGAGPARQIDVEVDGRRFKVRVYEPEAPSGPGPAASGARARRRAEATGSRSAGRITAPMQGTIVSVHVAVGDAVEAGQPVCVLEAMKMENQVEADVTGTVAEVRVRPGDTVGGGDVLVVVVVAAAAAEAGGDGA